MSELPTTAALNCARTIAISPYNGEVEKINSNIYHHMRTHGKALHERGWPLVPVIPGKKAPGFGHEDGRTHHLEKWQTYCNAPPAVEAVNQWTGHDGLGGFDAGIGIILGGAIGVIAIDIDTNSSADTRAIQDLASVYLGKSPFIRRRGPRSALLYRCSEPLETVKIPGVVEVLGTGAHLFAMGWHPIGVEYDWPEQELQDNYPGDLPEITRAQRDQFYAAVHDLALKQGLLKSAGVRDTNPSKAARPSRVATDPPAAVPTGVLDATLDALPNDLDWDDWTRVGMAVRSCGGSLAQFDRWSQKSAKYDSCATERRWNGLKSSRDDVRFGTLVRMLRDRGVAMPEIVRKHTQQYKQAAQLSLPEINQLGVFQDEHGRYWEGLARSTAAPAPLATARPIEDVRASVAASIGGFMGLAERFHAEKSLPIPTAAEQHAMAQAGTYRIHSLRQINQEETGSGKSAAFARSMRTFFSASGEPAWNVIYVAKNGSMAEQMASDLEKQSVPHINVRGAAKLCGNHDLRPTVKALSERALPIENTCNSCKLRHKCDYLAQRAPVRGHVIIVQIAHLLLDNIPPLRDLDNSAPIFATFVDECITQSFQQTSRARLSDLKKPLRVPNPKLSPRKGEDDAGRAERLKAADGEAADASAKINEIRAGLLAVFEGIQQPRSPEGKAREGVRVRVPMINLAPLQDCFLGGHGGTDSFAAIRLEELQDALRRFRGAVIDHAQAQITSGKKLDLRGRAAATLQRLNHLEAVLATIVENVGRRDELAAGLCVEFTGKRGVPVVVASHMRQLPKRVTEAPICFLDATADTADIESLLREKGNIVANSYTRPEWLVHEARATRPFARHRKVVGAPVSAGQWGRNKSDRTDLSWRKGRTQQNGTFYDSGEPISHDVKKPLDMAALRSDHPAKQLERYLAGAVASAQGSVGIIAPKAMAAAFKKRRWAADVIFGWHGMGAGLNDWAKCRALYVIGQNRPKDDAVEDLAMALAAAHPDKPSITIDGRYRTMTEPIAIDGSTWDMRTLSFTDPLVQKVLRQMQHAQSIQAYGRLRGSSRCSPDACELIAVDQVAAGEWDEAEVFEAPSELDVFEAKHGRQPASGREAVDLEPDLFRSPKHAASLIRDRAKMQSNSTVNGPLPISAYRDPQSPSSTSYKALIGDGRLTVELSQQRSHTEPAHPDKRSPLHGVAWGSMVQAVKEAGPSSARVARRVFELTGTKVSAYAVDGRKALFLDKASTGTPAEPCVSGNPKSKFYGFPLAQLRALVEKHGGVAERLQDPLAAMGVQASITAIRNTLKTHALLADKPPEPPMTISEPHELHASTQATVQDARWLAPSPAATLPAAKIAKATSERGNHLSGDVAPLS